MSSSSSLDSAEECQICYDAVTEPVSCGNEGCQGVFCQDCFERWVESCPKRTCPYCVQPVLTEVRGMSELVRHLRRYIGCYSCTFGCIIGVCILLFLTIFFASYMPSKEKANEYKRTVGHWRETYCRYTNLVQEDFACAKKINGVCSPCPAEAGRCDDMVASLTQGVCCNGFACCLYEDRCKKDLNKKCTGGKNGCTCQKNVCVSSVADTVAWVDVGTCSNMRCELEFDGYVKKDIVTYCDLFDFDCVANWWEDRKALHTCYYDSRNPVGTVQFAPLKKMIVNVVAFAFCLVFAIVDCLLLFVLMGAGGLVLQSARIYGSEGIVCYEGNWMGTFGGNKEIFQIINNGVLQKTV